MRNSLLYEYGSRCISSSIGTSSNSNTIDVSNQSKRFSSFAARDSLPWQTTTLFAPVSGSDYNYRIVAVVVVLVEFNLFYSRHHLKA